MRLYCNEELESNDSKVFDAFYLLDLCILAVCN